MRIRHAVGTTLILAGISLAPDARAQVTPPANRVRVVESACPCRGCTCRSNSKRALIVGQMVRQSNDSIVIVPDSPSSQGTEQVFVLGREHRVKRSVGMRPRTLLGMGIGLLGGAVGGGILATAMYEPPNCANRVSFLSSCNVDGGASNTLAGAVVGSVPGLVIGGLVGASRGGQNQK